MQLSECVDLELITDVDIYHFIENSMRGRISMITTRYARANVPALPEYDASLPSQNLIYLDANNLYGRAMSQPLPTHGFHFLQANEIDALGDVIQLGTILSMVIYSWISAVHTIFTILTTTTHSPRVVGDRS